MWNLDLLSRHVYDFRVTYINKQSHIYLLQTDQFHFVWVKFNLWCGMPKGVSTYLSLSVSCFRILRQPTDVCIDLVWMKLLEWGRQKVAIQKDETCYYLNNYLIINNKQNNFLYYFIKFFEFFGLKELLVIVITFDWILKLIWSDVYGGPRQIEGVVSYCSSDSCTIFIWTPICFS